MKIARGIRNNNPLNIRRTPSDKWRGLARMQCDKSFCQFSQMEWGWRAAFRLLTNTYYDKYQLQTIRSIVSRWAPSADGNDTMGYISNVCRLLGIAPDEPLGDPHLYPARWIMLGAAMAFQENGYNSVDIFEMLRGWNLMAPDSRL